MNYKDRNAIFIVRVIFFIFLGYFVIMAAFQFSQGPDRRFNMGNNYYISRSPGPIIYLRTSKLGDTWDLVIPGKISAFLIKEPWFVGLTKGLDKEGWFAINKKTGEVYYPVETIEQIEDITKLSICQSDLKTSYPTSIWFPSRYEVIWPHTKRIVLVTALVYTLIFFIFCIGPKRLKKIYGFMFKK